MAAFIKRNMPVLLIGVITLGIFIIIIIAGQKKPPTAPILREIPEEELITDTTPLLGNPNAPITLIEFADFKCPACATLHQVVHQLHEQYPNELRIGFRNFPLPQHPGAKEAAIAAIAAGEQDEFWEYIDKLFLNQKDTFDTENLVDYAQSLGIDVQKFKQDMEKAAFSEIVAKDIRSGKALGITGTPTFFLNGQQITFETIEDFINQIETALANYVTPTPQINEATPQDTEETPKDDNLLLTPKELEESMTTLMITFTEDGWNPKSATGYAGQLVQWTNATDKDITLEQLDQKFPELSDGKTIEAGGTFTFRLYKDRTWRYREKESKKWGSIYIKNVTRDEYNLSE